MRGTLVMLHFPAIHLQELHDQKTRWWKRSKVRVAIYMYRRKHSSFNGKKEKEKQVEFVASYRYLPAAAGVHESHH